jgi:hypothetical protein
MKRAEHQLTLPGVEEMKQQDEKEWKELMGFPLSESALKIDMGTAVLPEEKQALWSVEDEKRMDVIGPNGNDGDHYNVKTLDDVSNIKSLKAGDAITVTQEVQRNINPMSWDVIGAGNGD